MLSDPAIPATTMRIKALPRGSFVRGTESTCHWRTFGGPKRAITQRPGWVGVGAVVGIVWVSWERERSRSRSGWHFCFVCHCIWGNTAFAAEGQGPLVSAKVRFLRRSQLTNYTSLELPSLMSILCCALHNHYRRAMPLSCQSCRGLKRRCDRQKPVCTLCLKAERECVYPRRKSKAAAVVTHDGSPASPHTADAAVDLALKANGEDDESSRDVPCLFLDSALARHAQPCASSTVLWKDVAPPELQYELQEIKEIGHAYFDSTHQWFPCGWCQGPSCIPQPCC